jgi:hypothetical protein
VTAAEQQRFLALYDQERKRGQSFDDALRASLHAVLMSGTFRYLAAPGSSGIEPDLGNLHDQAAIASRISFLLWGQPPDDELRKLAAEKKLRDPQVLDAQVARLLADPRSAGFASPFVTQWLEMGQPITVAMDHLSKQDHRFGRNLKASMQAETIFYVGELLRQNRPARELIDSDWTMMNDILARHYGYEGIDGGHFRLVSLKKDDPRGGGILGQAGIQSMLCWMGENWVIYRGAWTLRRILDDPPPPPPLEVPELIPSDGKNAGKTFKQMRSARSATRIWIRWASPSRISISAAAGESGSSRSMFATNSTARLSGAAAARIARWIPPASCHEASSLPRSRNANPGS